MQTKYKTIVEKASRYVPREEGNYEIIIDDEEHGGPRIEYNGVDIKMMDISVKKRAAYEESAWAGIRKKIKFKQPIVEIDESEDDISLTNVTQEKGEK
jgi:hypothetical protein